ncbi:Protein of unknown function [Pyronema omphalodes CBS 100304]|uniref:Uncharacterized protein n=1 Tax=Pyronema omphalodes (strain CBS 100304) TaxID=1076935 RepID=U4LXZ6_PYROM|nr:Protein of unknown function [Pyronema omphalodes CBS 100304]
MYVDRSFVPFPHRGRWPQVAVVVAFFDASLRAFSLVRSCGRRRSVLQTLRGTLAQATQ